MSLAMIRVEDATGKAKARRCDGVEKVEYLEDDIVGKSYERGRCGGEACCA